MSLPDVELTLSPEELKEKYRQERERRLRADGNAQYLELTGVFSELDDDPYAEGDFNRAPMDDEMEVLVVGGGFGGMLAAAHLRKQGIDDFRIIEKGSDFGGTWYWNRYPGAACDVESYIYLPLLDDTGYVPREKYSKAPEIQEYCQLLARKFDMYDAAIFRTQVTGARWDAGRSRWIVETDRGDTLAPRFLIIAGGILHKAKLPGIPGIETFKGHAFHTSRWDYDYTGGGPLQFMDKLGDKTVGIIGTGATSIQAVPKLAEAAGKLYVFQRTPSGVGPRGNRPTDPEWAASLKPGWAKERADNFIATLSGRKPAVDMVEDGWTYIFRNDGVDPSMSEEEVDQAKQIADYKRMEEVRARVDEIVTDKATAEALKPWYNQMCKRPCFHDEYLQSFNRPNVKLVDTGGKGVQQINEKGPVVDGVEYPVDLLIYASGFEVTTEYTRRMGFDPIGPNGVSLSQAWGEGPETLHGTTVRGFPNLMPISTVQGGQSVNFVHMIHEAAKHIAHIIRWCEDHDVETIQPKKEATDAWFMQLMGHVMGYAKTLIDCTPAYQNNEGAGGDMKMARTTPFMGPPDEFIRILEDWRAKNDFSELELTYQPESVAS